ncbi:glycosyltransferase family 2 protein [Aurantiacibacter odishensis]|uniref:glycosyltransferase family 2 protein n=1 Tax=Aurantiacibacter odishensis TaxID=1155476 RepID=UPI000E747851|nr:glycosyltransferase family A protein [Aurantiacibacter odishensis]
MHQTSIIIPAYNSEHCVGIAIESALAQSRAPKEIIVVDDGSTDRTSEVIASFGDKVVHLSQENAGQGAARNTGLRAATGEFIAFLDADDYQKPEFVERMESFLETHPECLAVSCAFWIKRKKGDYYGPPHHEMLKAEHPDGLVLDNFFAFWGEYDHVRTGGVMFRRNVLDTIGYQNADLRISQDLEYWAMIGTVGQWGLLPEILYVGTSDAMGRKTGWRKKYAPRRKKAPTVSAWERRILPRLSAEQDEGFKKLRGRVAAGYMMAHTLGGSPTEGRNILNRYGDEMSSGTSISLLKAADRLGRPGWFVATQALRLIDRLK